MSLEDRDIRYAKSGDVHLAYMMFGDGPVDLVWSSPGISNVEGFWNESPLKEMADRLSSFSRFITYDQRGAGLSDPVPAQSLPTLEQRGDEIRTVLDAAGSQRAAIVGQGHGGPACMLFAATYPERVSSLVLFDTYARWMRDDDYPEGMPADVTARFHDFVLKLWGTGSSIEGFLPSQAHD